MAKYLDKFAESNDLLVDLGYYRLDDSNSRYWQHAETGKTAELLECGTIIYNN